MIAGGSPDKVNLEQIVRDVAGEVVRDAPTELRCVGLRVDWYACAFRVDLSRDARRALERAASDARGMLDRGDDERASKRKSAPFTFGDVAGELQPRKVKGAFTITNGLMKIDVDTTDAWSVVVELRAMYLAKIPFESAIEAARAIARSFGAIDGERVRRIDLAADVVGWRIDASDATALIGRALRTCGRGSVADYRPGVDDFAWTPKDREHVDAEVLAMESRTFWAGHRVTGITVCAGSPIMARIYDKTIELSLHGREAKREAEETRWRANGWRGERVTRIEFQIRSEILREFRDGVGNDDERSARNPDRLIGWLDAIFAYCTSQWARLILPGTSERLCRCHVDPRWTFLRSLRFRHEAEPAIRLRTRRGADVAGVLGCARSLAASTGTSFAMAVPPILFSNERFARWFVSNFVEAQMSRAAELCVRQLLARCVGPDDAAALAGELMNAHNASVARFATSPLDLAHPVVPAFVRDAFYEVDERDALAADVAGRPLTYAELVKLLEDTKRDVGLSFVDVRERETDDCPN